jgi:hypothetical protein
MAPLKHKERHRIIIFFIFYCTPSPSLTFFSSQHAARKYEQPKDAYCSDLSTAAVAAVKPST